MFRNFRDMLRYCRPYRRLYVAGTIALFFVDLLDAFTPKLVQWGIEHLENARDGVAVGNPLVSVLPDGWFGEGALAGGMWTYGTAFVLVVGLMGIFRYFMFMGFARAGVRLIYRLRGDLFAHLQRLDAGYHDRTKVGDHMSLATNDTEACRMFYGIGLLILIDTAFYFLLIPVFMVSISWKLLLASLVTLPLIPPLTKRITGAVERRFERVQEQFATVSEGARESFAGAKVVKSFAREESEVRRFAQLSKEYFHRGMRFAKVLSLQGPSLMLLLGLADLVVVVFGGSLVLRGEITTGGYAAFFQYLIRLSGPMMGLGWTMMLYQRARVSMGRIREVMAVAPAIADPEDPEPVARIRGEIEVRDLDFAYPGGGPTVLRGISFHVAPGGTLGIVGAVGSGKSTILDLIPRIYDPPAGTVFVDGHDVRRLPLAALRGAIGAVPQDTFLFSETIRENIALGLGGEEAEEDGRVEAAARTARIDGEIALLPGGYGTLLGERGVNLSGGQKQRVAIARALARRPAILLLDDCLSSVDTETEASILRGLREAIRDLTAVIVSHRVSAVKDADEILVLEEGRISARGRHENLITEGGLYAELHEKQRIEEGVEG